MHQFRLAAATRSFNQPLVESIKSAAKIGVEGIQFDVRNELRSTELSSTGRRDLMNQVSEYGLKIASAVFPLNTALYVPDRIDARINAIRDAMKFAYSLNATTLCLRVGQIPADVESTERKLLVEVLCDLARYANHVGTTLAIIPTDDSAESLEKLFNEITTGPIGFDFDPSHFVMTGRPVIESLRLLHRFVVHVQLRDGMRGLDGSQEMAVGQGKVDWIEVMALLGEMDYGGWLTSVRNQGEDRFRDMARSVKVIRQILLGG